MEERQGLKGGCRWIWIDNKKINFRAIFLQNTFKGGDDGSLPRLKKSPQMPLS